MLDRMRPRERRARSDGGFTLVELIVAMGLFAVVLTLIASATTVMAHSLRKQQGQSDDLDGSRKVVDLLDRQVRYANAIVQPGTNAAGTTTYVEWRSGDTGQPQTCTQWRFDSVAGTLAYRTWPEATGVVTNWVPQATGVVKSGATPVFLTSALAPVAGGSGSTPSPTPTPTPSVSSSALVPLHATLIVTFGLRAGTPSTTSRSQLTLTAIDTSGVATPGGVCSSVTSAQGLRP